MLPLFGSRALTRGRNAACALPSLTHTAAPLRPPFLFQTQPTSGCEACFRLRRLTASKLQHAASCRTAPQFRSCNRTTPTLRSLRFCHVSAQLPVPSFTPAPRSPPPPPCLLYTSPRPRDRTRSPMPSSACKKKTHHPLYTLQSCSSLPTHLYHLFRSSLSTSHL